MWYCDCRALDSKLHFKNWSLESNMTVELLTNVTVECDCRALDSTSSNVTVELCTNVNVML